MNGDNPLVSIVTVVLNGEDHLEKAVQSVLNQTYPSIEYIVIDGGSTDGSLDIIKKYEEQIDHWVSEPDEGIFDAMNKGITLSSGEIIGILNSDDWYEPDAVSRTVEKYRHSSEPVIIYGDIKKFSSSGREEDAVRSTFPDKSLVLGCTINHPACFVSRSTYKKVGIFKPAYDLAADYEFLLRAWKAGVNFVYINRVLTHFRKGGYSSNFIKSAVQSHKARLANGIPRIPSLFSIVRLFLLHYAKKAGEILKSAVKK